MGRIGDNHIGLGYGGRHIAAEHLVHVLPQLALHQGISFGFLVLLLHFLLGHLHGLFELLALNDVVRNGDDDEDDGSDNQQLGRHVRNVHHTIPKIRLHQGQQLGNLSANQQVGRNEDHRHLDDGLHHIEGTLEGEEGLLEILTKFWQYL